MEQYDNEVVLQGKIIRLVINDKMPEIASAVIDTTASKDRQNRNRPMVMFFGDNAKKIRQYKIGDFIRILGSIQSHQQKNNDGKEVISQNVVASTITLPESDINKEFGVTSQVEYFKKENQVKEAGIVTGKSYPKENICYIMLRTVRHGIPTRVLLKIFVNERNREILDGITRNDNICAIGSVQTKMKMQNERRIYFENLVVSELSKIA